MDEFIYCIRQEAGWTTLIAAFVVITTAVCLGIIFLRMGIDTWRSRAEEKIIIGKGRWYEIRISVPTSVVLGMILLFAIPGSVWVTYDMFNSAYAVQIDFSNNAGGSLEELRRFYANDTRTRVKISSSVKEFYVVEDVSGVCVADLFMSICRQHADDLECTNGFFERSVEVDQRLN